MKRARSLAAAFALCSCGGTLTTIGPSDASGVDLDEAQIEFCLRAGYGPPNYCDASTGEEVTPETGPDLAPEAAPEVTSTQAPALEGGLCALNAGPVENDHAEGGPVAKCPSGFVCTQLATQWTCCPPPVGPDGAPGPELFNCLQFGSSFTCLPGQQCL